MPYIWILLITLWFIWHMMKYQYCLPPTNRWPVRANQTLETFLRIFCDEQQDNWASLLPIAQYSLNFQPSHMTCIAPFEALMGYIPTIHQNMPILCFSDLQDRIKHVFLVRQKIQYHISSRMNDQIDEIPCIYHWGQGLARLEKPED